MLKRTVIVEKIGMPTSIFKSRKYSKLRKLALEEVGLMYFKKILPKHFKSENEHEYNYKQRSTKYLKYKRKKARKKGQTDSPLVFRGTLRRMLLNNGNVRATSKRVVIRSQVPSYIGRAGVNSYISDELKQLSKADRRRISMTFGNVYSKLLKEEKFKERVKIS